jgi:hypothetical protein
MLYMLQLIRALQIILHLAMNKIVFPALVMIVFASLVEVAMFDVLGEERICSNCNVDTLLEYDQEQIESKQQYILGQLQDLGYPSYIALQNLGSIGTFLVLYIIKVAFVGCLMLMTWATKSKSLATFKDILYRQAFFGDLFVILIDSYYEILISAYLQLGLPDDGVEVTASRVLFAIPYEKVHGETVSKLLIVLFLIVALVVVPLSLFYIQLHDLEEINSREFR